MDPTGQFHRNWIGDIPPRLNSSEILHPSPIQNFVLCQSSHNHVLLIEGNGDTSLRTWNAYLNFEQLGIKGYHNK